MPTPDEEIEKECEVKRYPPGIALGCCDKRESILAESTPVIAL